MGEAATAEKQRFGSAVFWRLFALINLVTVAWVVWLLWQITPRPVVNEFVMHLPPPQSQSQSQYPRTASGMLPAPHEAAMPSGPPMAPLRMETQIKTPPQ